jgi:hypothetical protein
MIRSCLEKKRYHEIIDAQKMFMELVHLVHNLGTILVSLSDKKLTHVSVELSKKEISRRKFQFQYYIFILITT